MNCGPWATAFLAGLVGGVALILVLELLFAQSQVERALPPDEMAE